MTTHIAERQEDLIAYLLQLINDNNKKEAIEKILELPEDSQLEILDSLLTLHYNAQPISLAIMIAQMYDVLRREINTDNPVLATMRVGKYDLDRNITFAHDLDLARKLAEKLLISLISTSNFLNSPDNSLLLAGEFAGELASVLKSAFVSDLERERNLNNYLNSNRKTTSRNRVFQRLREYTRQLSHQRNLQRDSDLVVARSLVLNLIRNLDFPSVSFSAPSFKNFLDIANIIALLILGSNPSLPTIQEASIIYYQNLADALDKLLEIQQQESSDILDVVMQVIEKLLEGNLRHITLEGVDSITPDILANQITPYVQALNSYLTLHAELTGKQFSGLRIVQIHNTFPKIELIGVGDAIRAIKEFFHFGTKKDDAQARQIELQRKQLEYQVLKKEAEQKTTQMELARPNLEAEARAQLVEIEARAIKAQVEARQALLEQEQREEEASRRRHNSYMQDAAKHIKEIAPNLSDEARIEYVIRLAAIFRLKDKTGLQGRFGSHDGSYPPGSDVPLPGLPKPPK